MKRLNILVILLIATLTSCSKSDDNNSNLVNSETEYLPLSNGNYWVYKVSGTDFVSGRDSLYVANDTLISGNKYQNLKTEDEAIGFYSASASRNSARKIGDKIVITGSAGLDFTEALPLEISLTDFVVFKESAADGEILDSKTGSFEQEFNAIPLTITYTLKTVASAKLTSFTAPDLTVYSNVRPVSTIIALKITTSLGGFPIPVLNQQDVVVSKQYYAENIGVVYTKTTVAYQLQDLASSLPIPQNYTQISEEVLDNYLVD